MIVDGVMLQNEVPRAHRSWSSARHEHEKGGSRCKDTEQCFPVPKLNTARIDATTGLPRVPDTGYACCPKVIEHPGRGIP
eukprot:159-Rhodomonas_salina.4